MKIVVDRSKCVGHARCQALAPALVSLDDLGYIGADSIDVPAGQEALARRVVRACPEQVLRLEGDGPAVSAGPA